MRFVVVTSFVAMEKTHNILPNVEVTGDPLAAARGAGMFVIYSSLDFPERAALWIVRWTVLFGFLLFWSWKVTNQ